MLFSDTYTTIANRFKNWLQQSNEGAVYVADLALDYANRAQDSLEMEASRGWNYLTADRVALTLGGSTGLECTLPTDCGVLLAVYHDANGDYKPDMYFYKDGKIVAGFQFTDTFAPTTGHARKIKFYYAPTGVPYCRYQKILADFTGTGTEYSFFPGQLLLLEMQRQRCIEKGLLNEYKSIDAEYTKQLRKFKEQHQNCAEAMEIDINDANGLPVSIPEYGLGAGTRQRQLFGRRNDYDHVRM